MRMFAMIPFALLAAAGYIFYRVWRMIPPGYGVRWVWIVVMAALLASFFVGRMAQGKLPLDAASALYRVGMGWLFLSFYLLLAFLLVDLVRLLHLLPLRPYLVHSWTGLGIVVATGALTYFVGNRIYHCKKRVELTVEAPVERPLKVVAASDLHLGYHIGPREARRWVARINAERPDAVVLAGDVVDGALRPVREWDLAAVLRGIEAPVYAVPGNHEYYAGIDGALKFLSDAGVTVLRDETVEIAGLRVVGRDDRSNRRRAPLDELLADRAPGQPTLLLDHQPYDLQGAVEQWVTLQFSGHTHHGQIWPVNSATNRVFDLAYGYQRRGDTHFYVTSGLGLWGAKLRLGTRSEYIVITITP